MAAQDARDIAEGGPDAVIPAGEACGEIGEEPGGASLASAPDDDAVAARLLHHPDRVLRGPDVAVAEHRDAGHQLLELGDGVPASLAGIVLLDGAPVQGDRSCADLLGDQTGVPERLVILVDADAGLDRDGPTVGGLDRGRHDAREQLGLPGQDAAASAAGDLGGDRAAEVQVDVIGLSRSTSISTARRTVAGSTP